MVLTKEKLEQVLEYDETSSTCLYWKDPHMELIGKEAGHIPTNKKKTPFVYVYGRQASIAHIVWILNDMPALKDGEALSPKDDNLHNVRLDNLKKVVLYQVPLRSNLC